MNMCRRGKRSWLILLGGLAVLLLPGCCGFGLVCQTFFFSNGVTVDRLCGISHCDPLPNIEGGQQTTATVTLQGQHLTNPMLIFADGDGLSVSGWTFANGEIQVTLSVAVDATLGAHTLTSVFGSNGTPTNIDHATVHVTCPDCVPHARLASLAFTDGSQAIAPGATKTVRFLGSEFLNNSPVVEFHPDDPGLSLPPNTTISVQRQGTTDYFEVPIVVDPNARTGTHRVRVVTIAGRTEWKDIIVDSTVTSLPLPAAIPTLDSVRPSVVGVDTDVLIECHGSGFGGNRQVIITSVGADPTPAPTYAVVNGEADPNSIAVSKIHPTQPGEIKVQVKNVDTDLITDDIRISVVVPDPSAPVATNAATDGVHRGGAPYTLPISGTNLSNVSDVSWNGQGLSFSMTNPGSTTATVNVVASPNAPLTGNQATNLTITVPTGKSYPFPINILP